jgi:hypothetical protein
MGGGPSEIPMTPQDIFKRLQTKFGEKVIFDLHEDPKKDKDPWVR